VTDVNDIAAAGAAALEASGMQGAAAADKGRLFERARREVIGSGLSRELVGSGFSRTVEQSRAFFVPGRLEVLGKHTDYAGGRSLLCTVERGICLVAIPRDDDGIRIVDAADGSTVTCRLDPNLPSSAGDWSNYPMTVARRVARNFPGARRGVDIAFASDLPAAAGMSSSSALMIATFFALADANALDHADAYRREIHTSEELAGYLATVENGQDFGTLAGERGVGTFGGSEDHTAMLCCRAGFLSEYSFCPVRHERSIPLSDRYVFVIGVSGVSAEKTGAARDRYNRASLATQSILTLWREATRRDDRSLAAAVCAEAPDRIRDVLRKSADREFTSSLLLDRFDQFVEESNVLVPAAVDLFARGALESLGPVVDRSQDAAERLLGNQIDETIDLARSARALGALAASAFGAGFGGSVWALVPAAGAAEFEARWATDYRSRFPAVAGTSRFFITRPGPSALRVA
jgi:galactokinase